MRAMKLYVQPVWLLVVFALAMLARVTAETCNDEPVSRCVPQARCTAAVADTKGICKGQEVCCPTNAMSRPVKQKVLPVSTANHYKALKRGELEALDGDIDSSEDDSVVHDSTDKRDSLKIVHDPSGASSVVEHKSSFPSSTSISSISDHPSGSIDSDVGHKPTSNASPHSISSDDNLGLAMRGMHTVGSTIGESADLVTNKAGDRARSKSTAQRREQYYVRHRGHQRQNAGSDPTTDVLHPAHDVTSPELSVSGYFSPPVTSMTNIVKKKFFVAAPDLPDQLVPGAGVKEKHQEPKDNMKLFMHQCIELKQSMKRAKLQDRRTFVVKHFSQLFGAANNAQDAIVLKWTDEPALLHPAKELVQTEMTFFRALDGSIMYLEVLMDYVDSWKLVPDDIMPISSHTLRPACDAYIKMRQMSNELLGLMQVPFEHTQWEKPSEPVSEDNLQMFQAIVADPKFFDASMYLIFSKYYEACAEVTEAFDVQVTLLSEQIASFTAFNEAFLAAWGPGINTPADLLITAVQRGPRIPMQFQELAKSPSQLLLQLLQNRAQKLGLVSSNPLADAHAQISGLAVVKLNVGNMEMQRQAAHALGVTIQSHKPVLEEIKDLFGFKSVSLEGVALGCTFFLRSSRSKDKFSVKGNIVFIRELTASRLVLVYSATHKAFVTKKLLGAPYKIDKSLANVFEYKLYTEDNVIIPVSIPGNLVLKHAFLKYKEKPSSDATLLTDSHFNFDLNKPFDQQAQSDSTTDSDRDHYPKKKDKSAKKSKILRKSLKEPIKSSLIIDSDISPLPPHTTASHVPVDMSPPVRPAHQPAHHAFEDKRKEEKKKQSSDEEDSSF